MKAIYEEPDREKDFKDIPQTIAEAIAGKMKIQTARQFVEAVRVGAYPISNPQFKRICRAFKIKTT